MLEPATYDRLIDELIELRMSEVDKIWLQAELIYLLRSKMKVKAGDIAYQINCSSVYVNELAKTYAAFPDEFDRNKEMSFTIHKLCAKSDRPAYWLEQAEHHQWSTRQLTEAMKGKPLDNKLGKVQKLFDKVKKILDEGGEEGEWLYEQLCLQVATDP